MRSLAAAVAFLVLAPFVAAQGTKADYDRANSVRFWTSGKVKNAAIEANWTPDGTAFWYSRDGEGAGEGKKEFVLVDTAKGTREIVTKDKLPKDAKPSALPKKKFGK